MSLARLVSAALLLAACTSTRSGGATVPATTSSTAPALPPPAAGDVLQHHRAPSRDGVYVVPTLTRAAAAGIRAGFTASLPGSTF
jgi:hypothetical protein